MQRFKFGVGVPLRSQPHLQVSSVIVGTHPRDRLDGIQDVNVRYSRIASHLAFRFHVAQLHANVRADQSASDMVPVCGNLNQPCH
jgi:hypothetical protein